MASLLVAGSAAGGEPGGGRLTLALLMEKMAATPGIVAEFRETKSMALLAAPLESRGSLYFVPPDRLVRRTTSPGLSTLVIDGGRLRFRNEAGEDDVDLGRNPVVRQFVDHLMMLFQGDIERLRRTYDVEFAAEDRAWTLTLTPRDAPVTSFIRTIRLEGQGPRLREMVTIEPDGDRTTTTFEHIDAAHQFSAEDLATLFPPGDPTAAP